MFDQRIVPRLFVKSQGEQTTRLSLMLTTPPRKCVVRLTGGCGKMSDADAEGLYDLFAQAMSGFDGSLIFGGTRMVRRDDRGQVVPGITEIPSRLRPHCPNMVVLGVIPQTSDLQLDPDLGLVVSAEDGQPFITAVHPEQDLVLVVKTKEDDEEKWDAEYKECARLTGDLRDFAGFQSVLVSYNGGTVTEREILDTARRGWPIVLIRGSGRKTDEYAANGDFLKAYRRNVAVAEKDPVDLRMKLSQFGAMPAARLTLVGSRSA